LIINIEEEEEEEEEAQLLLHQPTIHMVSKKI
jgi:hypothetical protein